MSKKLAFLMDMVSCNNCKTCEVACKMEFQLPYGIQWRRVRVNEYVKENPKRFEQGFLTMSCNHCDNPVCKGVCPVNAYSVNAETGIVIQNSEVCIGCQSCISACPYGAPVYDKDINKVGKCDFCIDRLNAGLLPACVETCPNNALLCGPIGDMQKEGKVRGGGYTYINEPSITPISKTNPRIVICPTANSKP